ncbi:uncharacterized protein LOC119091866 [Pollicipes pollicipes]|uniref:uncharacterized protein LOC119091866 n=1 Tax=Pollicipes pollicipes TaxID=41117 RepID=UPI0018858B65|nr:uncharacterized protein LOC119091866 [Pollicipes pollicipes]
MVRLTSLLLGLGLAAGKTITPSQTSAIATAATKAAKTLQTPTQNRQGAVRFPAAPADRQAFQQLQKVYQSLPTNVKSQAASPVTPINRDGGHHHSSSSGYVQPSHGYSQPSVGYSQSSYDDSDSYGYTEAQSYSSGGGLLDNLGKYGAIIIPILLVIGLLFLFPSVVNVSGTRRRRAAAPVDDLDDPSDDLVYRLRTIYESISEDPLCTSRLFCELGSVVGDTPYTERILKYIGVFYPSKSTNMLVMRKAALADDPKCQLLACAAWEDE